MVHLWCAAALLALVQGKDCDDMWAVNRPSTIKVTGYINCKTDEVINLLGPVFGGGDRVGASSSWCPQKIVYTPAHGAPEKQTGWNLTGPTMLNETVDTYGCKRDWFLFFPITGLYCQHLSTAVGGKVQHWGSARCPKRTETAPTVRL